MKFIKENYKLIIFCLVIVFGTLFIALYKSNNNGEIYNFEHKSYELKDYTINEIVPIYITDEDIAKKYLSEYVNLMIYSPEEAYELLDNGSSVVRFKDYEDFSKYVERVVNNGFISTKVDKYTYKFNDGKKWLYVIDSFGTTYIFKENSLMDYRVVID